MMQNEDSSSVRVEVDAAMPGSGSADAPSVSETPTARTPSVVGSGSGLFVIELPQAG